MPIGKWLKVLSKLTKSQELKPQELSNKKYTFTDYKKKQSQHEFSIIGRFDNSVIIGTLVLQKPVFQN